LECPLEVGNSPVKTLTRERKEAVMAVERRRVFVNRVHDDRSRSVFAGAGDGAEQGVSKEIGAESSPLFGSVEREASEEEHRNRIRLTAP
jgi:hypothetical protein